MGRRIQICPQCGSTEIYYEAGMVTGQKYHCNRCGYIGSLIMERDLDDLEEIEED